MVCSEIPNQTLAVGVVGYQQPAIVIIKRIGGAGFFRTVSPAVCKLPGLLFEGHRDVDTYTTVLKKLLQGFCKSVQRCLDGRILNRLTCLAGEQAVDPR